MSTIRVTEFQAAEGMEEELFDFLKTLIPFIQSSKGCRNCQVLREKEAVSRFLVIEEWDREEDHIASVANFPKDEMEAAMRLLGAPPKGNYYYS